MATATASFILYPIVATLTAFYFFKFDESTAGALLTWMWIQMLTAISGGFFGFSLGSVMKNEVTATQMNMLFLMMFCFGGGIYVNVGEGVNYFVKAITYISPMRYTTELLMRRVLASKLGADIVLDLFGFTWGEELSMGALAAWTIAYFFIGWLSILWKTRDF